MYEFCIARGGVVLTKYLAVLHICMLGTAVSSYFKKDRTMTDILLRLLFFNGFGGTLYYILQQYRG